MKFVVAAGSVVSRAVLYTIGVVVSTVVTAFNLVLNLSVTASCIAAAVFIPFTLRAAVCLGSVVTVSV